MFKPIPFILISAVCLIGSLKAQESRAGATMISVGAGYGNLSSDVSGNVVSSTPEVNGTIDYFVIKCYSIGVSGAYQSVSSPNAFYNYNYLGYNNGTYSQTLSRFNLSLRSLFYFTKMDNPVFYIGLRVGYEFFKDDITPYSPYNSTTNLDPNQNTTTFQVLMGVRAYITPDFSTYLELGTGVPSYAEMGFSISIGGKSSASLPASTSGPAGPAPYVH
jgi:hypothetical protein